MSELDIPMLLLKCNEEEMPFLLDELHLNVSLKPSTEIQPNEAVRM